MKDKHSCEASSVTLDENSRVTLSTLKMLISIIVPALSLLFWFHNKTEVLKTRVDALNASVTFLQLQVADRWTRSMMVLFTTELELRNNRGTNVLIVPNSEEIAKRVPLPQTH